MKNIYYTIGIDPSINSTGVVIQKRIDNRVTKENFYIVKGEKLTKRELAASNDINNFDYLIYDKIPITGVRDTHELEAIKTKNFNSLVNVIINIIKDIKGKHDIAIVMEGISYGSVTKTRSIFDLAGLNYLIRNAIYELHNKNIRLFVCTPSEIKKYAVGNGNANKEQIINVFKLLKPSIDLPKLDDISDAFFMANYSSEMLTCK